MGLLAFVVGVHHKFTILAALLYTISHGQEHQAIIGRIVSLIFAKLTVTRKSRCDQSLQLISMEPDVQRKDESPRHSAEILSDHLQRSSSHELALSLDEPRKRRIFAE